MSGSTDVIKNFETPDRAGPGTSIVKERKGTEEAASDKVPKPATVTPPEEDGRKKSQAASECSLEAVALSQVESPEDNKHVRFDKEKEDAALVDSPDSTNSQRGLVSRRGGRCASPGRAVGVSSNESNVLEFKTFRSPEPRSKKDENDTVPSLCSASSMDKEKSGAGEASAAAKVKKEDASDSDRRKPTSISCDSALDQTSPLASHHANQTKMKKVKTDDRRKATTPTKKNNVSFSPVPPPRESADRPIHTPTRSPTDFQSLPTLHADGLKSPEGIFLSPHPPTPSENADNKKGAKKTKSEAKQSAEQKPAPKSPKASAPRSPKTPKSPRTPKRDQSDRFVSTPTNFAMDYGKYPTSASFDNSNVLAWLQSPTGNGLFSPGGFGSIMGSPSARVGLTPRSGLTPRGLTPRGGLGPRTPRTPTVSTSFFFSDVAGLPQSGDHLSPKPSGDGGKRTGSKGAYSNIICISPLASTKGKNGSSHTPTINFKEMFASPAERRRDLAFHGGSPGRGLKPRGAHGSATRDPNLDAVHLAERDLMEDEDLSVLLQLASTTPRGDRPVAVSTSSLQLPIIGGKESQGNSTRLSRKTNSRDHDDAADDAYRLGMRGSASAKDKKGASAAKDSKGGSSKTESSKKNVALHPGAHNPYSMPPHPYGHPDAPYYPPMPPGMAHSGSMRVVVGAPPPSRGPNSPPSPHGSRPYPMGPGDPNYPPPPYPHYPHHPGVPPPHMHPHYSHYPPPHHPPPRHMPMYGAQHPSSKSKTPKKTPKPVKLGAKRSSPGSAQKTPAKKMKKSSPVSASKRKNRSPQLTEKSDRQKAAAAIQAVNAASGGKNDKAAALAAAILRGVTMRPSGKWQAQLYFAGKSRYIGVFDTREKAALAYEIAREKLKSEKSNAEGGTLSPQQTENAVNAARKAAFEGVNERDPRLASK